MNTNEYNITENKKTENTQSNKYKKDSLLDIKQSLFQELTTQSSKKIKYKDNDESSLLNSKYINYFNIRNYDDNSIQDINILKKEKEKNNKGNKQKLENKKCQKLYNRNQNYNYNDNDINSYFKSQNQNKNSINISNSNFNMDNFYNNDNLIYILTTNNKNDTEKENNKEIDDKGEMHYDKKTSHIALPFCNYHKYNIKLPKKYTCNFKKCSCCGVPENIFFSKNNSQNNNNKLTINNNEKDLLNKETKHKKYRSVLDQFKNKNINKINTNKSQISESSESCQISDTNFNFQKPNNINVKISKNDYIIENENEFDNSNDNEDLSELELPNDFNMNDENELKKYRNLVNKTEKKPKTHFSIMYYKRLNKSYNQIYSKDLEDKNKVKNFELLRD